MGTLKGIRASKAKKTPAGKTGGCREMEDEFIE